MAGWQWASMYNTSTRPNVIYTNIGYKIESTHWTGNTQKPTTYTSEQIWRGPVSRGTGRERRALRHRRWSGKTRLSSYLPHVKISSSLQLWTKSAPLSVSVYEVKDNPAELPSRQQEYCERQKRGQRSTEAICILSVAIGSRLIQWFKHVINRKLSQRLAPDKSVKHDWEAKNNDNKVKKTVPVMFQFTE